MTEAKLSVAGSLLIAAVCLAVGAVLTIAGLIWYSGIDQAVSRTTQAWSFGQLKVVRGRYHRDDNALVVTGSESGWVLVTTGPVSIEAGDHPYLAWHLSGLRPGLDVRLIWRRSGEKGLRIRSVLQKNDGAVTLAMAGEDGWQGEITELGLSFQGELPGEVRIQGLSLLDASISSYLVALLQQWSAGDIWSQKSAHFRVFGDRGAAVPLTVAAALWVALSLLIYLLLAVRRGYALLVPALIFLCGWLLLDGRAFREKVYQAEVSSRQLAELNWHQRDQSVTEGPLFSFVAGIKAELPKESGRIFIFADEGRPAAEYERKKARYLLLPHRVYTGLVEPAVLEKMRKGDYLLVLGGGNTGAATNVSRWDGGEKLRLLRQSRMGRFYEVL